VVCAEDIMLTADTFIAIDSGESDAGEETFVPARQTPECAESASTHEDVTALLQERDSGHATTHGDDQPPDQPAEHASAQNCGDAGTAEGPIDAPLVDVSNDGQMPSGAQTDIQPPVDDVTALPADPAPPEAGASAPSLPDPSSLTSRLRNLVVAVGQVEELSQRAREVAATDLALYSGIAASQRQFEEGLAEAQRIGQEAQVVYHRAFGREARAVAEPAVFEAREVQQAFADLADTWRQQAETFLAEHPDVDALLAEQRQQEEDSRRRESARARADRFQQLVVATDAALRQGQLNDARECLKLLGREFPSEAERTAPLHERLDHRVRNANDALARRVLLQASELQGRGDFEAAVKLLEAVDVSGLSRETSEDVFGRWSAACSLLGQTGGLELLRYSPAQGRGVIVHRDPSVRYGMLVFSSLGMGPDYFEGRVVSGADRDGAAIMARARAFRPADLPPELGSGWYGRSYASGNAPAAEPVRH
jgi:hypothetical protein